MAAPQAALAAAGDPRIRVDTPPKAGSGDGQNAGQPWCQRPLAGHGHDFPSAARGRAGLAGIDEVPRPVGAVSVGASAERPAVAVRAMAHWGADSGASAAPQARPLLIVAAAGGRHGGRPRRWNDPLQRHLCDRLGRSVTVGHAPTGGAQGHPMAPRVCSHMRRHWAGQPWRTLETRLSYGRGTTTATGLRVTASLIEDVSAPGKRVADAVMNTLPVDHDVGCPPWHSTLRPGWRGARAT